ncbi:MAG TPA: hypothetical protein VE011_05180, partial [Candidatus Dormibacteraeota bacterium]|nr:hypothetical protein [Candidatus Dormibacteraeota bacterium]
GATDLLLRSTIENYVDGTAGGTNGQVEDVTTAYQYDGSGQRTRQTRSRRRDARALIAFGVAVAGARTLSRSSNAAGIWSFEIS